MDHDTPESKPNDGLFMFCGLCAEEFKKEDEANGDGPEHHILRLHRESQMAVLITKDGYAEIGCLRHRQLIKRLKLDPKEILEQGTCNCEICKQGGQHAEGN